MGGREIATAVIVIAAVLIIAVLPRRLLEERVPEPPQVWTPPVEPIIPLPPLPAPPRYDVSVSFHREQRCAAWRAGRCIRYFSNEWLGELTVTNQGKAGTFRTVLDVWLYWGRGAEEYYKTPGTPSSELPGSPWEWQDYFAQGQSRTYRFDYVTPRTGMPLFVRHYIRVYDPDNLIYEGIVDGGLFS